MQEPETAQVAQHVRELRNARRWSAQRLADELSKNGADWNRQVIAKLETGRRESISVGELMTLCAVLEVTPTYLLGLDDQRPDLGDERVTALEARVARLEATVADPR